MYKNINIISHSFILYILLIYKVKILALFATFCGGKKLNKNKNINIILALYILKYKAKTFALSP